MTPQFKCLLAAVLIALLSVMFGKDAFAEEAKFKFCFAETKADGEIGCTTGNRAVAFKDWLKHVDPSLTFVRAEVVSGKVIKVYYR